MFLTNLTSRPRDGDNRLGNHVPALAHRLGNQHLQHPFALLVSGKEGFIGEQEDRVLEMRIEVAPQRTITDFERGARRPCDRTLSDIRDALGKAGIVFIDEDGGGPGVRLKKPSGE